MFDLHDMASGLPYVIRGIDDTHSNESVLIIPITAKALQTNASHSGTVRSTGPTERLFQISVLELGGAGSRNWYICYTRASEVAYLAAWFQ